MGFPGKQPAANAGKGKDNKPADTKGEGPNPEQLLADAKKEAAEIRSNAEEEAAESKRQAEEDADSITAAAAVEAAEIRKDADKEAKEASEREQASGLGGIRELALELASQMRGGRNAISQRPPTYREVKEDVDLTETALYWLTASKNVITVGKVTPRYIEASPQVPVSVILLRYFKRKVEQRDDLGRRNGLFKTIICETGDKFCIRQDKAPAAPQHTHAETGVVIPSAAAHHGERVDPPAPLPGVSGENEGPAPERAADR